MSDLKPDAPSLTKTEYVRLELLKAIIAANPSKDATSYSYTRHLAHSATEMARIILGGDE